MTADAGDGVESGAAALADADELPGEVGAPEPADEVGPAEPPDADDGALSA